MIEVLTADLAPEIQFFAKKRRKTNQKKWQVNPKNQTPSGSSRKQFLIGAGVLAGGIVVGKLILDRLNSKEENKFDPYQGWERFRDGIMPAEILLAIGEDLSKDQTYAGFSEVGRLIVASQTNPDKANLSDLPAGKRLQLKFSELLREDGSLGRYLLRADGFYVDGSVKNKKTGETINGLFGEMVITDSFIEIDNSFSEAPTLGKKLILVKEFSHFLYTKSQKELITQQVLDKFDILSPQPADFGSFLQLNGFLRKSVKQIPSLGDLFDHAEVDLDGAGYWHIMPAFGKMKTQGVFTSRHLEVLESDNRVFIAALSRGILRQKAGGEFVWKEGIGPFSSEWTIITRSILKG